ncbi:MAG TPA: YdcF family protein [Bacteriovoracaceae bacterium]|nr:YdcF family protein [Bacteriovoracaceae bacterium]
MLSRKYVFESKTTRLHRLLISGVFISVISLALIISFLIYIPVYARMQKGRAAGAFFQKSPDAIAVFTGDKGRISYAMDLLKKNPSSRLFISGVHAANSFQTLLDKQANPTTGEALKTPGMQVDLDYESKNTFENVRETVQFLRENSDLNHVLIISSDYHIMRVKLIISHFIHGNKPEFYFDSVPNSYTSWKETRKLLKEAVKIARTFLILKVLREDTVLED